MRLAGHVPFDHPLDEGEIPALEVNMSLAVHPHHQNLTIPCRGVCGEQCPIGGQKAMSCEVELECTARQSDGTVMDEEGSSEDLLRSEIWMWSSPCLKTHDFDVHGLRSVRPVAVESATEILLCSLHIKSSVISGARVRMTHGRMTRA